MIFVVVLAYNEADALPDLIVDLDLALKAAGGGHRIIVVDDGSDDDTPQVMADLARTLPITALRHDSNLGVARTFDTGLRHAASSAGPDDPIITIEGDGTNDPARVSEVARVLAQGVDVVCASRYAPGGAYVGFPLKRRVFSWGANWAARLFFRIPGVRDYTLFFRGYRASALQKALAAWGGRFIECRGFAANAEILVKVARAGARCAEVPTVYRYDLKRGRSSMNVPRNLAEYLKLFWRTLCR